jgi:hypothetical protein
VSSTAHKQVSHILRFGFSSDQQVTIAESLQGSSTEGTFIRLLNVSVPARGCVGPNVSALFSGYWAPEVAWFTALRSAPRLGEPSARFATEYGYTLPVGHTVVAPTKAFAVKL